AARRNRNGPHLRFARFANMLAMFVLVACMTCSAAAVADSRRASEAPRGGEAPVLEVSLDAPAAPYPEIADLISSLEEDRRAVEAAGMRSVRSNFSHAFEIAQDLIGSAVAELARRSGNSSAQRALATRPWEVAQSRENISFLSRRVGRAAGAAPAVKLNVAPRRPADAAILRAISDIEQRRNLEGARRMEQAASEMAGVTQTVLDALRAGPGADGSAVPAGGLRRAAFSDSAAGFVEFARQGNGPQGGVRAIPPAVPFPTMA
ncbi:unnamed protein product, partial [Prorocentrum cordatum]